MNIIAAMVFIVLSIFSVAEIHNYYSVTSKTQIQLQYIKQEAKELTDFTNASYNYVISLGLSLSPATLTVSNLKSLGILPSDFPNQTPFGQTFVADFYIDPQNSNVLDLLVRTTGNFNNDLLLKSGLNGVLGETYISQSVVNQLSIPNFQNATGTYSGIVKGSVFTSGSNIINLPSSIDTSNTDAGVYIGAPNQYGYWLLNISVMYPSYYYGGIDANPPYLRLIQNGASINVVSQGWYNICPSYAEIVSSNISNFSSMSQNVWYNPPFGQNSLYCIPAYKSQVASISYSTPVEFFNAPASFPIAVDLAGSPSNNYNNGFGYTTTSFYNNTETSFYINPSSINGYVRPLYGIESMITSNWDGSLPMSNSAYFMPFSPAYSVVTEGGFQIQLSQPNGTINTYQFALAGYSIITGPGCYDSTLSGEAGFPVYYTGNAGGNADTSNCSASGYNLNSVGNMAFGWVINVNPSNSNSYTFPAESDSSFPMYEDWNNGQYYAVPLTVNTSNLLN
jgi:hypothetical protein